MKVLIGHVLSLSLSLSQKIKKRTNQIQIPYQVKIS